MNRIAVRCRDAVRRLRSRALRPAIEGLEDRKLLASANGGHWYYPDRITFSFAPDGTNIGGVYSNLYQTLNARTDTTTWKNQFRKAAAIWQEVAGFNIVEVADSGDTFGGGGYQQNDPRYGDIRIAGTPLHPSYLGYSLLPPPINGGPEAGEIVINTAQMWQINNDYDLLSVAIHEFGHSLGMGHSDIMAANMYSYYAWMKQKLNADDIAGIQSLWGGVPADSTPTNNVVANAIDLTPWIDAQGRVSYKWGFVTDSANPEWFKITVPATTTGTMQVTMQSSALSSLSPLMNILNPSKVQIASVSAPFVYGATVSQPVTNVVPGQTYYIQARAAQAGPGKNGAFGLLINFGTSPLPPIAPPNTTVAQQPNQGVDGWMPELTQKEMRQIQRRVRNLERQGQARGHDDEAGHSVIAINLGNGRKSYADVLLAPPGRRHPRFLIPRRFRRG